LHVSSELDSEVKYVSENKFLAAHVKKPDFPQLRQANMQGRFNKQTGRFLSENAL